ncbi:hypothetical protein COTS27_01579 [Spirochaetota bacterium]|nr:hypothetical protein COTS27_01579 [Spirochaetota bacterium]
MIKINNNNLEQQANHKVFMVSNNRLALILWICIGWISFQAAAYGAISFNQKDFSLEQEEYLSVHETIGLDGINMDEKIKETFALLPMYTNIILNIKVPPPILDKMFSDLIYTVEKSRKYSRTKYVIKKETDRWYNVQEPPTTEGNVYIIHLDKKAHRYVFFVEGTYETFTTLRGKMIVDVTFREIEGTQYFNVKTYVVLTNKFLWRMARLFSVFPTFRKRIETIVEQNIVYVIKVARHTAYSINKYEYTGK